MVKPPGVEDLLELAHAFKIKVDAAGTLRHCVCVAGTIFSISLFE
ncbi:MAG TPA: hypothetical protein VMZ27_14600 [Candidatus Saccharimonadales bacterium]|nr:hypothetical protein [Candidatus Saccharimonadales bacterium]